MHISTPQPDIIHLDWVAGDDRTHSPSVDSDDSRPPAEAYIAVGSLPWAGDKKADEKTRVATHVACNGDFHFYPNLISETLEQDSSNSDRQLIRRFFDDYDDWFTEVDISGDDTGNSRYIVYPTKELRQLIDSLVLGKRDVQRSHRGLYGGFSESGGSGVDSDEYPLERIRGEIESTRMLQSQWHRQNLAWYANNALEGRMAGMWKSRGELELRTRFMDRKRAGKSWASAVTPLENAAEGHEVATEITVTTWPFINDKDGEEKFENIPHMREELVDSIESLLKKLMREAVDKNQAPDYQTFFEYTDTGIPHAHVLVYGFSPDELMDEEEIAQYMYYQRRHCKEVSVRGVHVGEAGRWRYDDTDVPVRAYLLKGLRTLLDVAEGKKDMGRDAFSSSAGKMVPWKLALYMEMESRFSTNSQRLNSPIEEPKFEFIEYPETSILDVAECERDSESGRRNLAAQSPLDAVDRPASGLGRIHRAVVATLPVTLIVLISWLWGLIDRIE